MEGIVTRSIAITETLLQNLLDDRAVRIMDDHNVLCLVEQVQKNLIEIQSKIEGGME